MNKQENKECLIYDDRDKGYGEKISNICPTQRASRSGLKVIEKENKIENLRIRKLTPKECMKLMGFTDEDTNAMYEAGMSDAQIYHCAGDSLITTLFGALVGTMIHDETKLKKLLEDYIERIKNG